MDQIQRQFRGGGMAMARCRSQGSGGVDVELASTPRSSFRWPPGKTRQSERYDVRRPGVPQKPVIERRAAPRADQNYPYLGITKGRLAFQTAILQRLA